MPNENLYDIGMMECFFLGCGIYTDRANELLFEMELLYCEQIEAYKDEMEKYKSLFD